MKASCVVLTYQRHGNLPRILDELLATPAIAEVIVWNNNGQQSDELLSMLVSKYRTDPVHLMADKDKRNLYTWGRYVSARTAQCGVVCTQDDDVLVSREKWLRLFELFEGANGERLCAFLDKGHFEHGIKRDKYRHPYQWDGQERQTWEMLVGWGGVFQRDWAADLFREYFSMQPADELSYRKADRIFTVMLDRPHSVAVTEVEHLTGASSDDALYRQPGHWVKNEQAIKRALKVLSTRP